MAHIREQKIGGAATFQDLTDTPANYTGHSGKAVTVKASEDQLEFTTPAGGGDMLVATYDPAGKAAQLLATSDIQTTVGDPGSDTKVPSEQATREALNVINQKKVKSTYFATITSGTTSGQITKPAGAAADVDFIMDEWGTVTDALVSLIENGKPTFKSPVNAAGDTITTTFDTSGNYTFSDTPSPAADHALIYVYTCYLKNFVVTEALWETELLDYVADHAGTHTDGSDDIQNATNAQKGLATAAQITKLDGIETVADVTDAVNVGSTIHGVANKATPIDADKVPGTDTADGNTLKTSTWTNIKAFLKTYFDTLYTKYPDTGEQAFLDADHTKLDTIEDSATADQTKADIDGLAITTVGTLDAGNADAIVTKASSADINIGTEAVKVITPDTLAGSNLGTKNVVVKCVEDATALTTGNGKAHFTVPIELNGMNLVSVGSHVYTVSSSGLPTFQIHNLTDAVDILSTLLTIDATEKDSKDAATPAVINGAADDVATGDELRFDCDIAGTGTKGMEIRMGFRLP